MGGLYGDIGMLGEAPMGMDMSMLDNPIQAPQQRQVDPQMMAYGAAIQNIGNILGGRAPSANIGGAYMQGKQYNDSLRQNKAALARQAEQDEQNKLYRNAQIAEMSRKQGGGSVGTVSPKDYTAESIGKFNQSRDFNDLVRYKPKIVDIGGIQHRENPETNEWEPIVDLNSPAYLEQINQQVALKQEEQSKLAFTKDQSAWRANEITHLNSISSAESNVELMATTADRIRELVSANTTGYGAALSLWPESESRTLRGLLDTIKANSAFSTLTDLKKSGGTLGAISAPELVLLERKLGALDQAGESDELLRVLEQVLGQNSGTVDRLKYGYEENKKRYGTNLVSDAEAGVSDDDLINKYL